MIVDDNPANLELLGEMLRHHGHEVRSFPRARLALADAKRQAPELFLLDINMPEMNGYELCERLKSDAKLSSVPVIFLNALNATEVKLKGFQAACRLRLQAFAIRRSAGARPSSLGLTAGTACGT